MPRDLRHIPPDSLVEVTTRTLEGRFFLRPSRDTNELVTGVLAYSVVKHAMDIVAHVWLASHAHLLLVPRDAEHLARFMRDVNANVAKEINRLLHRRGTFWHDRYHAIVVSDEEDAQVARLRYLLSNSVKEGLVRHPAEWPGATSTPHILNGTLTRGVWFNRTAEWKARRRGETFGRYDHATEHEFRLVQLPCWAELIPREHRARAAQMCHEIEQEGRAADHRPLGVKKIQAQDPRSRPRTFRPTPKPRFHAATPAIRVMLEVQYREFVAAYRDAAEARLAGRSKPAFPAGSFPPPLPFCRGRPPPQSPPT